MIVTKRINSINSPIIVPDNYHAVPVLSWHAKSSPYYVFSPYFLKSDGNEEQYNMGNVIFECLWQGSKLFPIARPVTQTPHQLNKKIIWQYEGGVHLKDDIVTPEYFVWRQKLWACKDAIRYPNGRNHRHECAFSLLVDKNGNQTRLTYAEARLRIYAQEYKRLVRKLPEYAELLQRLRNGENLCVLEIDVPARGKRGLYGRNVADDGTCVMSIELIKQLVADVSEPFGHGLCLTWALLEDVDATT